MLLTQSVPCRRCCQCLGNVFLTPTHMTHVVVPRWKKDPTTGIVEIPTSWWNSTRSFCLRRLEEKSSAMQTSKQRACIIYISNTHRNWQCFCRNRSAIGGGSSYTSQQPIELMWNETVLEGASIYHFSHTPTDTGPNCHWSGDWKGEMLVSRGTG
jgi:hypothetical protein